jgi:hypothetical protein
MYVVAAELARVRPAFSITVILGHPLALLACAAVWIVAFSQPLQTSVLVRIVSIEVFDSVFLHRRYLPPLQVFYRRLYLLSRDNYLDLNHIVPGLFVRAGIGTLKISSGCRAVSGPGRSAARFCGATRLDRIGGKTEA